MKNYKLDPDADPNCPACHGRGWVLVPSGPDDVDKDPCICLFSAWAKEAIDNWGKKGKKGKKMASLVVASYPSKSKPGKSYDIIIPDGGGEAYCTCWQWKRNRTCKHLEMYHNKVSPTVKTEVKRLVPETKEECFDEEIANAVNNIINKS